MVYIIIVKFIIFKTVVFYNIFKFKSIHICTLLIQTYNLCLYGENTR